MVTLTAPGYDAATLAEGLGAGLLYRAVPQIADPSKFEVSFPWVDPAKAREMLKQADADPEFRQRLVPDRDVKRWRILVETDRFVHFLPNGPLCYGEDGMLLNGKSRLLGTAGQKRKVGFMVVRNVPRWMFKFFDTPRLKTLNDIWHSAGRMPKPQTGTTMRLAMRIEEMLHGLRAQTGWRNWGSPNTVRDEHVDIDDFLLRREDLADLYLPAQQVSGKAHLVISALMVFRFYQQLAWPAGTDAMDEFWTAGLKMGALPAGSPANVLRAWGRDAYQDKERFAAKRELHLALLLRAFAEHARGETVSRQQWAYGFEMPVPYHPDGPDVAHKTILDALAELDAAANFTPAAAH